MSAFTEKTKNLISVVELKHLLVDIKDKRPDVCLRYRPLGEMWVTNFMKIRYVGDHSVLLHDERNNKLINLSDLSMIMQFEIDSPFLGFQPHFHYNVQPDLA